MAHYIKTIIEELVQRIDDLKTESLNTRFQSLCEQLDQLDPLDFEPAHRAEFVQLSRIFRQYAAVADNHIPTFERIFAQPFEINIEKFKPTLGRMELLEFVVPLIHKEHLISGAVCLGIAQLTKNRLTSLKEVLDSYLSKNRVGSARKFPFVQDAKLRVILERDYRDLTLRIFPIQAWKSVVILAGSILEGLLHDLLTRDPARIAAAMATTNAPRRNRRNGPGAKNLQSPLLADQWTLYDYILVADELALLPQGWIDSVQVVLRDFRNYVHPRKELNSQDQITEGEAYQSVGALMRICDHITNNYP